MTTVISYFMSVQPPSPPSHAEPGGDTHPLAVGFGKRGERKYIYIYMYTRCTCT